MSARSRRERTIGLLVSIVMLGLIGWAATHRGGTASEREASALAALEATGIDHARVRVDGVRVTVLGVARDREQREDALPPPGRRADRRRNTAPLGGGPALPVLGHATY